MFNSKRIGLIWLIVTSIMIVIGLWLLIDQVGPSVEAAVPIEAAGVSTSDKYIVLAWNDLGMHCYNRDFSDLAVLPPYNTLWAQVIKVGDPPQIVTSGISVTYSFPDNTYSVGKSNFWTYAQQLFGLPAPLTPNIGLTGKGLAGNMDFATDHFVATGIPLTEFRDSAPSTPYPFQLATIIVRDKQTGLELARSTTVAPVSTEMHCDSCHDDYGRAGDGNIATGKVETNILTLHDQEEGTHLMTSRPVLCANCHSSNALGAPGKPGIPSLSNAMHEQHKEIVPDTINGCYNCHPGPTTLCLRDVMSQKHSMTCINCHGGMDAVSQNNNPWLHEPRCDNSGCHGSTYQQNQALYRFSTEHGGVYCEGCHDSTHAIAPSREPNDAIKFIDLQGHAGTLDKCTVCHTTWPTGAGPHGFVAPPTPIVSLTPDRASVLEANSQIVYTHTLKNSGNISDTYQLTWTSSQGWGNVTADAGGTSIWLNTDQFTTIRVTVTVPNGSIGLIDRTIVTATSTFSPTVYTRSIDLTLVPYARSYLPLILK